MRYLIIFLFLISCQAGGYRLINSQQTWLEVQKITSGLSKSSAGLLGCSLYFTYENRSSLALQPSFLIEAIFNDNRSVEFTYNTNRPLEPKETTNFSTSEDENIQILFEKIPCNDIVDVKIKSEKYKDFKFRLKK